MVYTIVETFVGCGGAHLGFLNKGFKSLFVNDINQDMINTLLKNNVIKQGEFHIGPIQELSNDIINKYISENTDVDVLFGGIVCKGFSLAGVRNPFDERNYFYQDQLRIVSHLKPKVSIIENVVGLKEMVLYRKNDFTSKVFEEYTQLSDTNKKLNGEKSALRKANQSYESISQTINANKKHMQKMLQSVSEYKYKIMEDIERMYFELGYKVYSQVLKASDYECCTSRQRLIIVAVRNDVLKEYIFPSKVESDTSLLKALQLIDYNGVNHPSIDIDNKAMSHNAKTVKRFSKIPEGKNIADVMDDLEDDMKISKFYSRGNTQRLDRNKPAPTLVPGHSNFPIHPWEHRSITVREAATITGFPLTYKFCGSHTARCMQIGNAVPVKLAEHIAQSVLDLLDT